MKVALVSDIHGNLTALRSVLAEVRKADRVVCLGDVAATGPQPRETISFLRKAKWPCVLGNTDETLSKSEREKFEKAPEGEREKLTALDEWTGSELDAADRQFLSRFSPTVEVKTRRYDLLCYHGSPRSNTEQVLPSLTDEELGEIFEGTRARVYAGGHTHSQMVRKLGDSVVVNPGSVGLPFLKTAGGRVLNPAWAEYAILTSSGDDLSVELRREKYSKRDLEEAVVNSGMPDPVWWLRDWV